MTNKALTPPLKPRALYSLSISLGIISAALIYAQGGLAQLGYAQSTSHQQDTQPEAEEVGLLNVEGVWIPEAGRVGQTSITWLGVSTTPSLYALGSGEIFWRADSNDRERTEDGGLRALWRSIGAYAPELSWDEGEGVAASGPFSPKVLANIEREVGALIEAQIDGQGDEDWLSEDTVNFILDSYISEESPAVDSPYRLSGVMTDLNGVWVSTGAGIWNINQDRLTPLDLSPTPTLSITRAHKKLWVSTPEGVWVWDHLPTSLMPIKEASIPLPETALETSSPPSNLKEDEAAWQRVFEVPNALLSHLNGTLWFLSSGTLYHSSDGSSFSIHPTPPGEAQSLTEGGDRLWLLNERTLYESHPLPSGAVQWRRCHVYSSPPTHVRWSEGWLVATSDEAVWLTRSTCDETRKFNLPYRGAIGFRDALIHQGVLYAATSGGLFSWSAGALRTDKRVALPFLKRELNLFPNLSSLYSRALIERSLDPKQGGYGKRPVLSALLPQVRLSYQTHPSREEQTPTFSEGNRQLTLLQPVPDLQFFVEWRVSFDFLTRLIDPDRGNVYTEIQSQMDSALEQPGSDLALEETFGAPDTWSDETYTSQAQRLALTSIALERRQMHRERAKLYTDLSKLHRERLQLTYRLYLTPPESPQIKQEWGIRLQEIDALLDAFTGYQLHIQDTMRLERNTIR